MYYFSRLFETYPDMKDVFGPFRSMHPEDQRYSSVMKAHGERVLHTVDDVLKRQRRPEELIDFLHDLGHTHLTFNAKADYLDVRLLVLYAYDSNLGAIFFFFFFSYKDNILPEAIKILLKKYFQIKNVLFLL